MTTRSETVLGQLLRRFRQNGDAAAMEEFVRRTRPRLLSAARRIGGAQEAEDCVQAAYHSLLRRADSPADAPLAWLTVAVVRIAYRRKAISRRERTLAEHLAVERVYDNPEHVAEKEEEVRMLRAEVTRLPSKYRDVVVLHYFEGLSIPEVARLLEVPSSTAQTRLRRARRLLEGRLAPWVTRSLLCIPWILLDATRAAAGSNPVIVGGTMKLKSAVMIAGVGLASGAVGLGIGTSWSSAGQATQVERSARSNEGARVARLMLELDAARAQAADLARQLDGQQGTRGEQRAHGGTQGADVAGEQRGLGAATGIGDGEVRPVSDAIRRAAKSAGVTAPAIRAALKARRLLQELASARSAGTENRGQLEVDAHAALAALKAYGEEGYLAVLALLRGGESGLYLTRMLEETWAPGWEPHLQALVVDAGVPPLSRSSALQGLGVVDTHEGRRFLLDYLERTEDPMLFYGAAAALGALGEAEGARFVADKLDRQGWEGLRAHLFVALGGMGGDEAKRIIVDYLERPSSTTDLFYAVAALLRIDPAAAEVQAAQILDGPHGAKLGKVAREYMEQWAGR